MLEIKARNILLKENSKEVFYLVSSNKEEIEELRKAIKECDGSVYPFFNQIEVLGRSEDATKEIANRYIPIERSRDRWEANEENIKKKVYWVEVEYKCYCRGERIPENNIIVHEEPLSALKCAIYRIGQPDYVYILKIKKEEFKDKVESIKENYEDNSGNSSIREESTNVGSTT